MDFESSAQIAVLCDGPFFFRKGMHCLHGGLLCECMWVIELEASGIIKEQFKVANTATS